MTTVPGSHRDLLESPVGVLGTVGPDARPQLSAVWFRAQRDVPPFSLTTSTGECM